MTSTINVDDDDYYSLTSGAETHVLITTLGSSHKVLLSTYWLTEMMKKAKTCIFVFTVISQQVAQVNADSCTCMTFD